MLFMTVEHAATNHPGRVDMGGVHHTLIGVYDWAAVVTTFSSFFIPPLNQSISSALSLELRDCVVCYPRLEASGAGGVSYC